MTDNTKVVARITAFWALCESGLGGVLHAIQLPFKGAILTLLSLLCISMIARWSTSPRKSILRALTVVLLIKAAVSPHSPITAYLAVGFQGVLGALLYGSGFNQWLLGLHALLSFFESALQRVLTMWLFFGVSLWKGLDDLGQKVGEFFGYVNTGSELILFLYFGIYGMIGLLGWWWIPRFMDQLEFKRRNVPSISEVDSSSEKDAKSKVFRYAPLLLFALVIALYFVSRDGLGSGLYVFLRSILVIFLWFRYVGPWLARLLIGFLEKRATHLQAYIRDAQALFPQMIRAMRYFIREKRSEGWSAVLIYTLSYILWYDE